MLVPSRVALVLWMILNVLACRIVLTLKPQYMCASHGQIWQRMMPCNLQRESKITVETILSITNHLHLPHSSFHPAGSFSSLGWISSCKERDSTNSGWIVTTSHAHIIPQKDPKSVFWKWNPLQMALFGWGFEREIIHQTKCWTVWIRKDSLPNSHLVFLYDIPMVFWWILMAAAQRCRPFRAWALWADPSL